MLYLIAHFMEEFECEDKKSPLAPKGEQKYYMMTNSLWLKASS
jgi:hypothetical protein